MVCKCYVWCKITQKKQELFFECFLLSGAIWTIPYITKTRLFKYIENFTAKNWKFLDKNSDIFCISTQNVDCGYSLELPHQSGSNKYSQSMFLSRNKKNNVYPYKPQFYYLRVGFKGSVLYRHVFVMTQIFGQILLDPDQTDQGIQYVFFKQYFL